MVNLYYCYLSATFVDLCLGASVPHDIIKGEQHWENNIIQPNVTLPKN